MVWGGEREVRRTQGVERERGSEGEGGEGVFKGDE